MDWTEQITELQEYFKDFVLPETLVMTPYANVVDCKLFVSSHLSTVIEKNGKPTFLPYLERLQALMNYFKSHSECYPEIVINPLNNKLIPEKV